jgi:hypothetical protein
VRDKPITREQAVELAESGFWEDMDFRQRAEFQMWAVKLSMPFEVFHEAVEKTLGRPVYTHEFGLDWEGVYRELLGERPAPTFEEIVNLIPEEKRILLLPGRSD